MEQSWGIPLTAGTLEVLKGNPLSALILDDDADIRHDALANADPFRPSHDCCSRSYSFGAGLGSLRLGTGMG